MYWNNILKGIEYDEWETEEFEIAVTCPECGHLFYLYEDLETTLWGN